MLTSDTTFLTLSKPQSLSHRLMYLPVWDWLRGVRVRKSPFVHVFDSVQHCCSTSQAIPKKLLRCEVIYLWAAMEWESRGFEER